MADGTGKTSTGLPVMYLPTPDPTSVDIAADAHCSLAFSEAALPQRLTGNGTCGGMDAEDPTCARLVLSGKLTYISPISPLYLLQLRLSPHPLGQADPNLNPTPTPTPSPNICQSELRSKDSPVIKSTGNGMLEISGSTISGKMTLLGGEVTPT